MVLSMNVCDSCCQALTIACFSSTINCDVGVRCDVTKADDELVCKKISAILPLSSVIEFSRCLRWGGMAPFFLATCSLGFTEQGTVATFYRCGGWTCYHLMWRFSIPKIPQSVNFWLSYLKKIKVAPFFGPPCIFGRAAITCTGPHF